MTPQIIAVGRIIDGRCELTAIGQDGQRYTFAGTAAEGKRFMELLAEREAVSVDEFKNEPQMEVV